MSGRLVVDLACGGKRDPKAQIGVDIYPGPEVDIITDLATFPWPIVGETFDEAMCHQFIEHLPTGGSVPGDDPFFRFFDEVWRILKPGGTFAFDVPHYRSVDAVGDPTHRRLFDVRTFDDLWNPARNPAYPRRIWERVSFRVSRDYPHRVRFVRHLPSVDLLAQAVRFGTRRYVHGVLRRPEFIGRGSAPPWRAGMASK